MVVQDNVQQVKDAYGAFGRGDIAAVMETLSDDIEWIIPGPSEIPTSGTQRGKQAVQTWFGTLAQTIAYQRFEPYEFIADGDKVVVLLHVEGTMQHNKRSFAGDEAHVFTTRGGKTVRFHAFEDTEAFATAFRGK